MNRINNNDYTSIIPTAILTAYPRILTDIPYSKEIFNELNKEDISKDLLIDKLAPELEARYKLVDRLIKKTSITQIFELASGYSTRGLVFTEDKDVSYVELDLKEVCDRKKKIFNTITTIPNNLHILSGNALDPKDFNKCEKYFDKNKPACVINEGLLRYLSFDEKRIVAKNIYNLLSKHGGVWITCDVTPKKFIENQDKNMPKLNTNISNVSDRNNADWRFEDNKHVKRFFEDIGFNLEFHSFKEVKDELTSTKKLALKDDEIDRLLDSATVVVFRKK